jgi:agmatine deiminase
MRLSLLNLLNFATTTQRYLSSTITNSASDRSSSTITWPAEWGPHSACILLYPHNPGTYRLDRVATEFLAVVRSIQEKGEESVVLFCKDALQAEQVRDKLRRADEGGETEASIVVLTCPSNDTWARDTSPTFVVDSSKTLVGLDWDFNAYGGEADGCYWPCTADQQVAATMCREISDCSLVTVQHKKVPLVLEGGSIHTDGQGTILTTKECLLHPNRNPTKSRGEIEEAVLAATGCSKMIWLEHGLAFDDDTNGHIDNWACFVAPSTLVLAWTDDAVNHAENYKRCRAALSVLEASTDASGRRLTVHKLHIPKPIFYSPDEIGTLQQQLGGATKVLPRRVGERMAASYVNFYIANKAVIVPQFGDAEYDPKAVKVLQELFSDRMVVGVNSHEILIGGGNIHCITQQIPTI